MTYCKRCILHYIRVNSLLAHGSYIIKELNILSFFSYFAFDVKHYVNYEIRKDLFIIIDKFNFDADKSFDIESIGKYLTLSVDYFFFISVNCLETDVIAYVSYIQNNS